MASIIHDVMTHSSLLSNPPVLVDIGASGKIHEKWKPIAKYSICIAFDADTRDFEACYSEDKGWHKLFSFNCIVSQKTVDEVDFFLTQSPYCSSSLPPNQEALKSWAFSPLFDVEKVVQLNAIDLKSSLAKAGLDYIDWYKSDSQGTDMRIFDSLPKNIINKIIAADFEPGIIDAYQGEDKLHNLMAYMDKEQFWITNMEIKGSQRINKEDLESLNYLQRRSIESFLKIAPGWCEISYLNRMDEEKMTHREYLLAWLFSSINAEHGFALSVTKKAYDRFGDNFFLKLQKESRRRLSYGYLSLGKKVLKHILKLKQ